jgi:CRP-like cAMP-binding protein
MVDNLALLNGNEFFASLPDDLRSEIALSAVERVLSSGDVLLYEGDPSVTLFLLVEGEIHLTRNQQGREVLYPQQIIDEASILSGQPHRMRAVAAGSCRLLTWIMDDLLEDHRFRDAARLQLGRSLVAAQTRLADVNTPIHYTSGAAISPGPFIFENASIIFAFCEADSDPILATLPDGLSLLRLPGRSRAPVFITFADFPNSYPEQDESARFGYTETSVFIPVRCGSVPGVHIPYLYPSAWEAILIGREVYGFPKQLGHTIISTQDASLSVDGALNLNLSWDGTNQSSEAELVGALMGWLGIERHLAAAAFQLGDLARSAAGLPPHRRVDVFCHKRNPSVDSTASIPRYDVDQLTHAVFGVLRWHQVMRVLNPRLSVSNGPLVDMHLNLLDAYRTRLNMRLSTGKIERNY